MKLNIAKYILANMGTGKYCKIVANNIPGGEGCNSCPVLDICGASIETRRAALEHLIASLTLTPSNNLTIYDKITLALEE